MNQKKALKVFPIASWKAEVPVRFSRDQQIHLRPSKNQQEDFYNHYNFSEVFYGQWKIFAILLKVSRIFSKSTIGQWKNYDSMDN